MGATALSFILMILLVVQEVKVSGHPSLLPIKEIGHRGTFVPPSSATLSTHDAWTMFPHLPQI